MSRPRRTALPAVAAVLATLGWTGTAAAHVQLQPSVVAPEDPVEFTVLVPSERPAHTTKVDLKLPPGVLPFAYGETPGWKRRLVEADDGAIERVVWTGKLAKDGYARFTFLAGTPEKPTTLTWKALQTYDDGTVARWIGTPESESPAPVTKVVAGAPRQNAGGEGGGDAGGGAGDGAGGGGGPSAGAGAAAPATSVAASSDGDGTDGLARGLGIAAVVLGLVGVGLAARRRTR
jgi:uncharacterized protein YcnI